MIVLYFFPNLQELVNKERNELSVGNFCNTVIISKS